MVVDNIIEADDVLNIVSEYLGLTIEEIKSRRRFGNYVEARIIAAYMMHTYTNMNLGSIAEALGMKYVRHDTIIHYLKEAELRMSQSKIFAKKMEDVESKVIYLVSGDLSVSDDEFDENTISKSKFIHVMMDSINWQEKGTTREAIGVAYYNIFIKKQFNTN